MSVVEPRLIQVKIQFNSCYCGLDLKAIKLPEYCYCLGLAREKQVILATDNPQIACGDYILAVALQRGITSELEVTLKKTHSVLWSSFRSTFPAQDADEFQQDFFGKLCCQD